MPESGPFGSVRGVCSNAHPYRDITLPFHGRFVKLVTNEQVVEVVEFETTDPALRGEMTITIALADADGGTDVLAVHDGLPRGLPTADNEAGWRSSLAKLAALVEAGYWLAVRPRERN